MLYNVPGRTVADMSNDTIVRLSSVPGIVGVKDATGNIARGAELLRQWPRFRSQFWVVLPHPPQIDTTALPARVAARAAAAAVASQPVAAP